MLQRWGDQIESQIGIFQFGPPVLKMGFHLSHLYRQYTVVCTFGIGNLLEGLYSKCPNLLSCSVKSGFDKTLAPQLLPNLNLALK
jgi:hypothetical protein